MGSADWAVGRPGLRRRAPQGHLAYGPRQPGLHGELLGAARARESLDEGGTVPSLRIGAPLQALREPPPAETVDAPLQVARTRRTLRAALTRAPRRAAAQSGWQPQRTLWSERGPLFNPALGALPQSCRSGASRPAGTHRAQPAAVLSRPRSHQ
eukprot:TRINITY_DN35875_c0_g1_i2.p1 TRINITY_DN35875_c0_g1~~TRINITY_DN35875_c0_g1_i2.p1  ORF type:complete len:178 (-),score=6.09 TRINITY_DN35875_c0_g1_i2:13-474(-)